MATNDSIWALSGGPPVFDPYQKYQKSTSTRQAASTGSNANSNKTTKRGLEDQNVQGKAAKRARTTEASVSEETEASSEEQPPKAALYDIYDADKLESRWKEEYDRIAREEQEVGSASAGGGGSSSTRTTGSSSAVASSQQSRAASSNSREAPVARRTRSKRRQSVNDLLEEIHSEKSTTENSLQNLSEKVKEGKRKKVEGHTGESQ